MLVYFGSFSAINAQLLWGKGARFYLGRSSLHLPFRSSSHDHGSSSEKINYLRTKIPLNCPLHNLTFYGLLDINPAGIYLLNVKSGNFKTMCEICSELIVKAPERRQ